MSLPEVPKKPPAPSSSPPEGAALATSDQTEAGSNGKAELNYLKVLSEAGPIYKGFKAGNGVLPQAIDLSANPFPSTDKAHPVTRATAESQLATANAFVASFTGSESRTALNDWIFGDATNGVKHTKAGDTTIHAKNADGLAVTADITKGSITAGGDGWKVTHDKVTGESIYESKTFLASEKDGIKTIKDKERGTTLQWDSKNKHGVVYDANGKIAFEFNSLSSFETEVKARLTDDRYLNMLNSKHSYEQAVRDHFALHVKNPNLRDHEEIFTDGRGNYSVITQDGLLYQYDKDSKTTYLEKGDVRIRVHDGIAYAVQRNAQTGAQTEVQIHDFKKFHQLGLEQVVAAKGAFNAGQTRLNAALGTLTTQSDQGPVTVTSANGATTLQRPSGALTLGRDGSVTNTDPETQGVLGHFDNKTNTLTGHTKGGASYEITPSDLQVKEANGQRTDLYDNGAVRAVDSHGKELFSLDKHGNASVAGQFTVSKDGEVKHHGKHVGDTDSTGRSTGTSVWDEATADIQGASGDLTLDNIGNLEGQLRNDYCVLNDLAARVTARGNIHVANILMSRANSILEALNTLDAQKAQLQSRQAAQSNTGNILANNNDATIDGDHPSTKGAGHRTEAPGSLIRRVDSTGGWVSGTPGAEYSRQVDAGQSGTISTPSQSRNSA